MEAATRPDPLTDYLDYLTARATGVVDTNYGFLRILGAYVPLLRRHPHRYTGSAG